VRPPGRELGLALQTDKPVGAYAELARRAEDAGFDVVTTFNDLWFQPALPALLEIAAATTRVRVGPSCLNPFTLHPVELAGQVAAVDRASGGRAFLGLAAGAWLEALGVDVSLPLTSVREAWEVVRSSRATTAASRAGASRSRPASGSATPSSAARCRSSSAPGLRVLRPSPAKPRTS
jgi:5,10-methylenetetrahydromethanopterin reductase